MDTGINNHLKRISSELFIKRDSREREKIGISLDSLIGKLLEYFDDEIDELMVFGSYSRDTILPRQFDENSDIDILIQFNTSDYEKLKPESYRNQLQKFAERNYPRSYVIKDHPSVVLELASIKFDLVPAIFDKGLFWDSIEIPSKNGGWLEAEPHKFNETVTKANKKYSSIVKPLIRLVKFWNACADYPYASFELEKHVASLDFSNHNYESGFLFLVNSLSTWYLPVGIERKVAALQGAAEDIQKHLRKGDPDKAKLCLDEILPGFY